MKYSFSCPATCNFEIRVDAKNEDEAVAKIAAEGAIHGRQFHPHISSMTEEQLRNEVRSGIVKAGSRVKSAVRGLLVFLVCPRFSPGCGGDLHSAATGAAVSNLVWLCRTPGPVHCRLPGIGVVPGVGSGCRPSAPDCDPGVESRRIGISRSVCAGCPAGPICLAGRDGRHRDRDHRALGGARSCPSPRLCGQPSIRGLEPLRDPGSHCRREHRGAQLGLHRKTRRKCDNGSDGAAAARAHPGFFCSVVHHVSRRSAPSGTEKLAS